MAAPRITRHFVTVRGERQVHYRRAGSGPPVVLLHQSPTSSTEYIPLIEELAAEFTVFAPDTAGNGLSDALSKDWPDMEDFADGVANLLDALKLPDVPVYGFHTGGVCALAMGLRHPNRASVYIMNGYLQMEKEERDEFLTHYLPPFAPEWSGAYLTWSWSRFREQSIFFPWYAKSASRRMAVDLPPPERIHWAVMEFFRAGDNYRRAYRPAFTFDTANAVRNMGANMVIMTAKTDPLDAYMAKMPKPPANVTTISPPDFVAAKDQAKEIFRKPARGTAPAVVPTEPMPGRIWAEYLQIDGASLYARRNTDAPGRPIVFIHASAGSALGMDRHMRPFIGKRPVLAVDLPGNGESDNPQDYKHGGSTVTVEAQARYLALAIKAAGYTEVDVYGYWGGSAVGIELAIQNPGLVKNLAVPSLHIREPAYRDELLAKYTPPVVPDTAGSHLIRVWHQVRDQELFAPWFKTDNAHAIKAPVEANLAPEVLHRRTVDLLKAANTYAGAYAAYFSYPEFERLAHTTCRVLVGAPGDAATEKAMKVLGSRGVAGLSIADFFTNG